MTFRYSFVAVALFLAFSAIVGGTREARAVDTAEAAGPPVKVAIFYSSRKEDCYDNGNIGAIEKLSKWQRDELNRRGGVSGRKIELVFFDDDRDQNRTIANMRQALAEPNMLALIGVSSPTRSKAMFDALGSEIKGSGLPFISDIAVSTIFAPYSNVFTTRASQNEDTLPLISEFTRKLGYQRLAFAGLQDALGSTSMGDGLKAKLSDKPFVYDERFAVEPGNKDNKISPDSIRAAVATLKEKNPDLIYLYVGGSNAQVFLKELTQAKFTPAIFLNGRIDAIDEEVTKAYTNAIFALGWDSPPDVFNGKLKRLITPRNASRWIFEGAKNEVAPGWKSGECKARPEVEWVDPLNAANLRALSIGSQYADMVALIAAAAVSESRTTDIVKLREEIVKKLSSVYQSGRGSFKGSFDNWSFVAKSRAAARDPFVMILPQGLGRAQLAPFQFVRTKDGALRPMDTLYVDVDLIRAHRMSENEKSFFADFYLSMRANDKATIDKLDFANAYVDQSSGGRQLSIEMIHAGGPSPAYPESMRIYKVSGRFLFEPLLAEYPFDTQRYSIDIQPKSGEAPFIIQPPPTVLRDSTVVADGWNGVEQYVGYDEDKVPVIDAYTHAPSVVPFYKTSFTWLMQRETTDYLLRVAVPLAFILFVAYLSIFIPRHHFEAVVTIQVTALLSAVALYLSLPKIASDTATISDRAFVFAYMVVSLMIGISILRVSPLFEERPGAERALRLVHVLLVPLLVGSAVFYVYSLHAAIH